MQRKTIARSRWPWMRTIWTGLGAAACSCALAQAAPPSFVASPDVYKVVAENEQYRVITVTWKPGQGDVAHSHPAAAVYSLTDCQLRFFAADGQSRDGTVNAGFANVQQPIPAHRVQNIGASDCRMVMFEPK